MKQSASIRKAPIHIGHPDLCPGAHMESKKHGLVYVSIPEAIFLERTSEFAVEIHWTPTALDEELLAGVRDRARARFQKDRMADGWFARQFDTTPIAPVGVPHIMPPSDEATTTKEVK